MGLPDMAMSRATAKLHVQAISSYKCSPEHRR